MTAHVRTVDVLRELVRTVPPSKLNAVATLIWLGQAEGELSETEADELAGMVEARRPKQRETWGRVPVNRLLSALSSDSPP